ncbi:MAG: type VII secretion target [Mycobacterium sp.]
MTELKVDAEKLREIANVMRTAAEGIPEPPAAYTASGADPISQAIADKVPGIEGVIQESLPQVKIDAMNTASNMVTAAGQYLDTDEQLAANYEKQQFDAAGGTGSGVGSETGTGTVGVQSASSASSDSLGQMSQLMSMPMQVASQAAQIPTQMMSAAAAVPQGIMQGVQQIGQMAGGFGGSDSESGSDDPAAEPQDVKHQEDAAEPDDQGAAAGSASELAPTTGVAPETSAPATPPVERPIGPRSTDPIDL